MADSVNCCAKYARYAKKCIILSLSCIETIDDSGYALTRLTSDFCEEKKW